ncbi:MAG: helicase-related protein [Armatimonadota bacterium]|nr:helicase-related protein [Armatimonadota bacterium]
MATLTFSKRRPEGGKQRELPWPMLRPDQCYHLTMYALPVLADDGDTYEVEVCPLCGHVEHVQASRHGQRPPRTMLVSKAAAETVDWRKDPRYRWITVHPHGEEEEGYPVLLRMDDPKGESGSGTIVGGAGGALNYRRITGVKTKGQYRTEARRKREERKAKREQRRAREREEARQAGLTEEEIAERERQRLETLSELQSGREKAEAEHLAELGELLGWEPTQLDERVKEQLPGKTADRLERERRRRLLRAADKVEKQVQDAVIERHERDMIEALGSSRPEDLTADEVEDTGLGYMAEVETLARENGLSPEQARRRGKIITNEALLVAEQEGYIEDAGRARNYIDSLQAMAALAREEDRPYREQGLHDPEAPIEVPPEKAPQVLLAREKFKQRMRQLQAMEREVKGAAPTDVTKVAAGSALVEIEPLSDEEALHKVEQSLQERAQTTAAVRLLTETEEIEGGPKTLQQHLLEGRHVQLEEVAQAVFRQPLTIPREVLDLLGPETAAALMARQIMRHTGDDAAAIRETLREHHMQQQTEQAQEAVRRAREHLEAAAHAFDGLGTIGELGPEGLEAASAANEEKLEHLHEARETLGLALGQLQMMGALNAALMEGQEDTIDVALGPVGNARALQIAAALGLDADDYELQTDGPNQYLRLGRSAWYKLMEEPDPEQVELYDRARSIKAGDDDEKGWLAEGLMRRPSDAYYEEADIEQVEGWDVDVAELLEAKYGPELEEALREYAGRMLANDGVGSAASLRNRVLSAEWQANNLDEFQQQQFAEIVARIWPAEEADDNWTAVGEELVKPFLEEADEERVALDAQQVNTASAWDPMHRALQEVPEGKVAWTPLSQMTPQDKALLRQYFWTHLTDEEPPAAAETREERAARAEAAEEIIAGQSNIFGEVEPVTRGETEAFQERVEAEEAERAENAWTRYVRAQKGTHKAYRSLQALVQGDLLTSFGEHYARETGRELRSAPADLPNALGHVVGLMPRDALERVLDADDKVLRQQYESLRKRDAAGRYAPGAVKDLAQRILEKAKKMQLTLFTEREPAASRTSIGRTAENQARRVWSNVAPNFDPERPVEIIHDLNMDGRYVHQQRAIKLLEQNKRIGLHHSTGCVAGDTVLIDPMTQQQKTVREHYQDGTAPRVLSLDHDGHFHVAEAAVPFIKGSERLFRVVSDDGNQITVARSHLFLTPGGWRRLADLDPGDLVAAATAASRSRTDRPTCEMSADRSQGANISPAAAMCRVSRDRAADRHRYGHVAYPVGTASEPVVCSTPYWVRVSTIEAGAEEEYFDFEVPVYHNYVAHGLIHHNSGKSLVAIGGFTDLHSKGQVKRGLFLVPPKIQAQFGGEMNRYVEPGRFRHFADPSADAEERRAAYADPERDMVAVSHQAWRDDVTWAVAQQRFDGNTEQAAQWLREASPDETSSAVQEAIDAQGWQFDFNMVDEGHDTLNRKGKPDSRLARVIDATTERAGYFISASATPVKNDPSEVYDLLYKIRPDKFPRDGYEEFRRRYGLNTEANRQALQRLVMPYFYANNVDTGVMEAHEDIGVGLSEWQRDRYRQVLEAYNDARRVPQGSEAQREALARLMPEEALAGLEGEARAQKLDDVGRSLGFARDRAVARVLEHAPPEHNPRIQKVIALAEKHRGDDADEGMIPGLVFAQSLQSVDMLADALEKAGFRVGKITGKLDGEETELQRMRFNADAGRGQETLEEEARTRRQQAQYDVLVGSAAAAIGLNLERARWLVHYDQPWTAKEMRQREGRQNRLTQRWGNVSVYTLGTNVPYERRRRKLLEEKQGLMSTFMEPTEQIDDTGLAREIREARGERLTRGLHRATGAARGVLAEAAT